MYYPVLYGTRFDPADLAPLRAWRSKCSSEQAGKHMCWVRKQCQRYIRPTLWLLSHYHIHTAVLRPCGVTDPLARD